MGNREGDRQTYTDRESDSEREVERERWETEKEIDRHTQTEKVIAKEK